MEESIMLRFWKNLFGFRAASKSSARSDRGVPLLETLEGQALIRLARRLCAEMDPSPATETTPAAVTEESTESMPAARSNQVLRDYDPMSKFDKNFRAFGTALAK